MSLFLVALAPVRDLLHFANYLFVAARSAMGLLIGMGPARRAATPRLRGSTSGCPEDSPPVEGRLTPPECRCLIFASRLQVVCPNPDLWPHDNAASATHSSHRERISRNKNLPDPEWRDDGAERDLQCVEVKPGRQRRRLRVRHDDADRHPNPSHESFRAPRKGALPPKPLRSGRRSALI